MHEKIDIKHFSIHLISLKNFAKINIKHFSSHFSPLERFEKKKIKHLMSHTTLSTMKWLIVCFIFFFSKRSSGLKWLEKCFILILAKFLREIKCIEKCFISIFSCMWKSLSQAKCFIFYTLGYLFSTIDTLKMLVTIAASAFWVRSDTRGRSLDEL